MLGVKPALPDLWLFDGEKHRFIEVKLPGDKVRKPQLAAFAVLATSLKARYPISLEVAEVNPRDGKPRDAQWDRAQQQFANYYARLVAAQRKSG